MESAAVIAARWAARMGEGSTAEKIRTKVTNLRVNPMELAATPEAEQKFLTGVTDSVTSGRRSAALRRVPKQRYVDGIIKKGLPILAQRARDAVAEVTQFWTEFGPHLEQVTEQVRSMPSQTFDQRIARMVAQAQGTHEFERRG